MGVLQSGISCIVCESERSLNHTQRPCLLSATLDTKLSTESLLKRFITLNFSALGLQHWVSICFRECQKKVLVLNSFISQVSKCSQPTLVLVFCSLLRLLVCTIQRAQLALMQSVQYASGRCISSLAPPHHE